ncbi:MAG: hypothetical protein LBC51_00865 [Treponema sp.]|jgi:hypothetical protein|nr:hypothetical protein [Treponema sp.]
MERKRIGIAGAGKISGIYLYGTQGPLPNTFGGPVLVRRGLGLGAIAAYPVQRSCSR